MDLRDLKINQGTLFHIYHWVLPLLIPSLILIGFSFFFEDISIIPFLLIQIYIYNVVILSTNMGLLHAQKNKKNPFKETNNAISICLIFFGISLLIASFFLSMSEFKFDLFSWILIILALLLTYISILMLSKNFAVAFMKKRESVLKLALKRTRTNDALGRTLKNE